MATRSISECDSDFASLPGVWIPNACTLYRTHCASASFLFYCIADSFGITLLKSARRAQSIRIKMRFCFVLPFGKANVTRNQAICIQCVIQAHRSQCSCRIE